MTTDYRGCQECLEYLDVRQPVLVPELARAANNDTSLLGGILDRYMAGVHARHLSGLPILPGTAA